MIATHDSYTYQKARNILINLFSMFWKCQKLDIKKQRTSEFLLKVLLSDKTVLCYNEKALPRAFKVFCRLNFHHLN